MLTIRCSALGIPCADIYRLPEHEILGLAIDSDVQQIGVPADEAVYKFINDRPGRGWSRDVEPRELICSQAGESNCLFKSSSVMAFGVSMVDSGVEEVNDDAYKG
jgi:hypothetical protein